MNRDSFVPPTNTGSISAAAAGTNVSKSFGARYICASCGSPVQLAKGEPVRCKECGHRVLYKERSRRVIQFEAR